MEEALKNRYSLYLDPCRATIRRLAEVPEFRATVDRLRGEDWLDWHVLAAVCGITVNYRISANRNVNAAPEEMESAYKAMMNRQESETEPSIPLSEFTEQAMRFNIYLVMASTLTNLGFE